jgi:hypothetical protein
MDDKLTDERDEHGYLTDVALAVAALEDAGCDCGTDEQGTCLACLCEAALKGERARMMEALAENVCDACMGTGTPLSGGECMCGGSGKMSDAAHHLRRRLVAAERARVAAVERLRGEVARVREARRQAVIAEAEVDRLREVLAIEVERLRGEEEE